MAPSRPYGAAGDGAPRKPQAAKAKTEAKIADLVSRIAELQGAIQDRDRTIAPLRAYLTAASGRTRDDARIEVLLGWIREIEGQLGREKRAPATRHDLTAGSESRVLSASPLKENDKQP